MSRIVASACEKFSRREQPRGAARDTYRYLFLNEAEAADAYACIFFKISRRQR